ncbi:MAG TPA: NAD(P)-dependent oxidoreductase [Gemmatimonadaceae bacterium]|nr:NAD(P)-dependent oxidoreductase [Gemmatimonadaceae bacterium]
MRVAFIGLGDIGTPMAGHLSTRFELSVWSRTKAKVEAFVQAHSAIAASSAADAASGAHVLVTCLPTSVEVDEVLFAAGAAEKLDHAALVLDCTSGDPATSRSIAARLLKNEIGFVDAPVSGGVVGAEAGKLTVMCGGTDSDVQRARPVLEAFASKIVHCGGVGAGHAVKAANQALLAVHIWATGEVLASLVKAGVDPALALEVINASSGRSNASQNLIPERVLTREFPRTFRLALLEKDVRIALELARGTGTAAPFTELAARLFASARVGLGEEADHVEAVRIIEREAGVEIAGHGSSPVR